MGDTNTTNYDQLQMLVNSLELAVLNPAGLSPQVAALRQRVINALGSLGFGASSMPGGAASQIQYNVGGVSFGGITGATSNGTEATFNAPVLGTATATSINGLTLTTSTGTLTIANGKVLTLSNTLTFTGTDGSSVNFGTGGTVLYTSGAVTSIAGTANQITASAATGAVTLSITTNPILPGNTTVTTINNLTITSSTGTLTIAAAKVLTFSNTLTFTGTDGSSVNFGTGGTVLYSGGSGFVSSITGTANQITASAATGAVTLSTPQDIATSSTPQFLRLGLSQAFSSTAILGITGIVGSSGIVLTGAIQTANFPMLNLAQTWNNGAVVFTGMLANVTNTASDSTSRLIDIQASTLSRFHVTISGSPVASCATTIGGGFAYRVDGDTISRAKIGLNTSDAGVMEFGAGGASARDVILTRDAANILAQRNSTNAQNKRLYNTFTDASNNEYVQLGFTSNVATLSTVANGTGTARNIAINSAGGAITGSGSSFLLNNNTGATIGSGTGTGQNILNLTLTGGNGSDNFIQFNINDPSGNNLGRWRTSGFIINTLFQTLSLGIGTSAPGGSGSILAAGSETILNATSIPAGGTAGSGYKFSSTSNFGVFFGSGAPTLAAAKGSLYLRSDGTGATDRAYINTDGSTTWTNLVTAL